MPEEQDATEAIETLKGENTRLEARVSSLERTEAALRLQLAWMQQGWERYIAGTLTL